MIAFSTRKTPVGCKRDAKDAAMGNLREVSNGLFKRVYVSHDRKVVYKIRVKDNYDVNMNKSRRMNLIAEAAWSAELRRLGVPGVPPVTLYIVCDMIVLAMPYYPERGQRLKDAAERAIRDRWYAEGMEDIHDANYRRDRRGKLWVIDLAGYAESYPKEVIPADVTRKLMNTPDRGMPPGRGDGNTLFSGENRDGDEYEYCACGCGAEEGYCEDFNDDEQEPTPEEQTPESTLSETPFKPCTCGACRRNRGE